VFLQDQIWTSRRASASIEHRAGHSAHGGGKTLRPIGGELGQDRLAVQRPEEDVGDQLGVDIGPLSRDQRTDVTVPELVDRVMAALLPCAPLAGRLAAAE
jgi:hypothetical protein